MITAPNFSDLDFVEHGFGMRDSVTPDDIRTAKQIHSSIVLDAEALAGGVSGAVDTPRADALVSRRGGVRIGVKTADCVPVLLVDPVNRAVAAIHAGWRGSAANIVGAAIRQLTTKWGTRPENLRAAIGPSIGLCCYEVGPEVARQFETWLPELASLSGHAHLDLPAVNEWQLREAGVTDIWKSGECTFCMADRFFSFRRERERAGRMMSFIGLQK
jgi:YfiH family protein